MTMKPDRIIVHTVAYDGGVIIEIAASADDYVYPYNWQFEVDQDGNIGSTFHSNSGVPMSLTISHNGRVTVLESEDLFATGDSVLFDSESVK